MSEAKQNRRTPTHAAIRQADDFLARFCDPDGKINITKIMTGFSELEAERDTWKAAAEERERLLVELQDAVENLSDTAKYDKTVTGYAKAALLQSGRE